MITILVSAVTAAAVTAAIYWYLHRANPGVAQAATDAVVDQIKADAKDAVDAVKEKVGQ